MPRERRHDVAGCWYHVYHRGVARRQVFVTRADYCFFRRLVGEAVVREEIEVHAYSLMQNHFHWLIRSRGGLSKAMKRVLESYVMRFNRVFERDGALFSGRYRSKLVGTLEYRCTLLRYIDHNAVHAGLAPIPEAYEWSSVSDLMNGGGREWLDQAWVREEVALRLGRGVRFEDGYRRIFASLSSEARDLVALRLARPSKSDDPDDFQRVIAAGQVSLREWFRERAIHADGKAVRQPLATPRAVLSVLAATSTVASGLPMDVVRTALLRELASLSFVEIGRLTSCSGKAAQARYTRHRTLAIQEDYADAVSQRAASCLPPDWGSDPVGVHVGV